MKEQHPSQELFDHHASGELPDQQVQSLEAHLKRCAVCQSRFAASRDLKRVLRQALAEDVATTALEAKILAAIQAEEGARIRVDEPVHWFERRSLLAIAALVVTLLGTWIVLSTQRPNPGDQAEPQTSLAVVERILIAAPPSEVWRTIVDPERSASFFFGLTPESVWKPGAGLVYRTLQGSEYMVATLLTVNEPYRLSYSVRFLRDETTAADPPSMVTWNLVATDDGSEVTLVHNGFTGETATYRIAVAGWPEALRRLAEVVESDAPSVRTLKP